MLPACPVPLRPTAKLRGKKRSFRPKVRNFQNVPVVHAARGHGGDVRASAPGGAAEQRAPASAPCWGGSRRPFRRRLRQAPSGTSADTHDRSPESLVRFPVGPMPVRSNSTMRFLHIKSHAHFAVVRKRRFAFKRRPLRSWHARIDCQAWWFQRGPTFNFRLSPICSSGGSAAFRRLRHS